MQNAIYHPQQMQWFVDRCNKNSFIVSGAIFEAGPIFIYRISDISVKRTIKRETVIAPSTKEEVEEFADTECAIARMVG